MLFTSHEFLFGFLPVVLGGFFLIARLSHRLGALWLAVSSIFFYGWWNATFVLLLLASIAFNYCAGVLIARARQDRFARFVLTSAIVLNLLVLGVFKYADFFIATSNLAGAHLRLLHFVLPLGISFFTFTQIAFLVDVYKKIATEYSFVHYLLFVTWFPHLIAGPLLHHKQMMPQFTVAATYQPNAESIALGVTLFTIGLIKKVVLADQLAAQADPCFGAAAQGHDPKLFEAWFGALAYSLQLYFDFSGYSDMAIGLSRLFNVRLPINFDSPYKSQNITEFWRRWHITLSTFLRDYLYIPLGGNRKGAWRRQANLMTTMLLGGLWHGAGWNFVLWGGLHGAYLVINHSWQQRGLLAAYASKRWYRVISTLLTFMCVVIAWVPFRAANFGASRNILSGMAGLNGVSVPRSFEAHVGQLFGDYASFTGLIPGASAAHAMLWIGLGLLLVWRTPNSQQVLSYLSEQFDPQTKPFMVRRALLPIQRNLIGLLVGMAFVVTAFSVSTFSPFIYFQF